MKPFITRSGNYINVTTPVGELEYVMVSGQGKLNTLNDKYYFSANLLLDKDSDECKQLIEEINEIWEDERTKKFSKKDPKSVGWSVHKVKTGELDEDEEPIYEETGKICFHFKTETTYKNGNDKVIKIHNSKGKEVSLGENKIGNGSRGRIEGVVSYYEQAKDAGVSLYLNTIQLAKFVAYVGGPGFDDIGEDEEDGGFEGFDTDGMDALPEKEVEESDAKKSKPRL